MRLSDGFSIYFLHFLHRVLELELRSSDFCTREDESIPNNTVYRID